MTERGHHIAVGLTAVIAIVVLCMLLLLFGYTPTQNGYELRINLPEAAGLREGHRVQFHGIDIGKVQKVDFREDHAAGVYAIAQIRDDVAIPSNALVSVNSTAMFGSGPMVSFEIPDDEDPAQEKLPRDGTAQINGQVLSLSSQLFSQFDSVLTEPMAKLERFITSFEALSKEWTAVGNNIAQLTVPRPLSEVNGNNPGNLSTVLARLDQRLVDMQNVLTSAEQAMTGLAKWTNDEQLRADLSQTAANANKLTSQLSEHADRLSRQYVKVADDMSAAVEELRKTIELARTGEGSAGKFLNDPGLYNNLNDAAQRLNLVMKEIHLLMEKMKKEGLPVKLGE